MWLAATLAAAAHHPCPAGEIVLSADTPSLAEAPASIVLLLTEAERQAADQGRLGLVPALPPADKGSADAAPASPWPAPVQWSPGTAGIAARGTWLVPRRCSPGTRLALRIFDEPFPRCMQAVLDPSTGQVSLREDGQPILRYNHRTVEPGPVLDQVTAANRIYARARSDYLHPLHDLDGRELTLDWATDHPHHRGIYWAWPEVEFGTERGDLHALQRVFARPLGEARTASGPVFAEVAAENLWRWEDRRPIVHERVVIRAYRAAPNGRVLDLAFRWVGLEDGVTIARRETRAYGGLNLRLATPQAQRIEVHTDPVGQVPRRAWSDLSGVFGGGQASGLTVLQHRDNPGYPGDWVQYPELSWCQPTFPTAGTRFPLPPGKPLVLRYRLWVHSGPGPDRETAARLWDNLHAPNAAFATPDAPEPARRVETPTQ